MIIAVVILQFKQMQINPKKFRGGEVKWDANPWPLHSHYSALPTEL